MVWQQSPDLKKMFKSGKNSSWHDIDDQFNKTWYSGWAWRKEGRTKINIIFQEISPESSLSCFTSEAIREFPRKKIALTSRSINTYRLIYIYSGPHFANNNNKKVFTCSQASLSSNIPTLTSLTAFLFISHPNPILSLRDYQVSTSYRNTAPISIWHWMF